MNPTVSLISPAGATSISWRGTSITADEMGVFDVPLDAVPDLAPHGLQPWVEPTPAGSSAHVYPDKPVPQWTNQDLKSKAAELGVDTTNLDRPSLIKAVCEAMNARQVGQ